MLFEPDNFKNDWYGELTNQLGHTLLGVVMSAAFCLAFNAWAGEMPHRLLVLAVVGLPYPLVIEWRLQGWRPGDAWFDSFMYLCGVLGPLVAFREIAPGQGVMPQGGPFFALLTIWFVCLAARVIRRM